MLWSAPAILTTSALGTRIRFGTPWTEQPDPFAPVDPDRFRVVATLVTVNATIAREFDLPILISASTTNGRDWVTATPRQRAHLADVDGQSLEAVTAALDRVPGVDAVVGGIVNPIGDPYDPTSGRSDRAAEVHATMAQNHLDAGADLLLLWPYPSVAAAAIATQATAAHDVDRVVSFILDSGGNVLDGTPLPHAMTIVDAASERRPRAYVIQCVHPRRARLGLEAVAAAAPAALDRILGVRANASDRDVTDLDESDTLHGGDHEEWAAAMTALRDDFGIRLLGGCCGTDERHTLSLALRLADPLSAPIHT